MDARITYDTLKFQLYLKKKLKEIYFCIFKKSGTILKPLNSQLSGVLCSTFPYSWKRNLQQQGEKCPIHAVPDTLPPHSGTEMLHSFLSPEMNFSTAAQIESWEIRIKKCLSTMSARKQDVSFIQFLLAFNHWNALSISSSSDRDTPFSLACLAV